jgi:hypothetical protein
MKWVPNPGPQTDAYFCPADVLLYGGQGGGGKSDLGLGLAFTAHHRSLIMRRKYANLSALTERAIKINGSRDGFNGSPPPLLRTDDGTDTFSSPATNTRATKRTGRAIPSTSSTSTRPPSSSKARSVSSGLAAIDRRETKGSRDSGVQPAAQCGR